MQETNHCFKAYGAEVLLMLVTAAIAFGFWQAWLAFDGERAAMFYGVAILAEIVACARLELLKSAFATQSYKLVCMLCWAALAIVIAVSAIKAQINHKLIFAGLTVLTAIFGAIFSRIMGAVLWDHHGDNTAED